MIRLGAVRLIYVRELRDQLRDRRTLFTLVALPLALYPLLGFGLLQMTQFLRERPTKILLAGVEQFEGDPTSPLELLDDQGRLRAEFASEREAGLLEIHSDFGSASVQSDAAEPGETEPSAAETSASELRDELARRWIAEGQFDAVVWFPPGFSERLTEYRRKLVERADQPRGTQQPQASPEEGESVPEDATLAPPEPQLYVDTASDRSRIAWSRIELILSRWREAWVQRSFEEVNLPSDVARPFELQTTDVAREQTKKAHLWAKILPFVALIWALTGAFYPAIDLCAGEKERGTLETLLSSPAERSEIVGGKMLAIATFSMATAILNLASMGITGAVAMRHMGNLAAQAGASVPLGPPPLATVLWLIVGLLPISLLFSALSLAIASFARSSKEGQYYLMPLLLVALPLILVPMLPSAELDLGTSLIPIAGMMLWMKALMEGDWYDAVRFAVPVFGITAIGVLLAAQWAVRQFSDESVLFRESERFSLRLWLAHLMRDRGDLPTFSQAMLCGILILVVRFFATFAATMPTSFGEFAIVQTVSLVAFFAAPAALMAVMLARKPLAALKLNVPHWASIPLAVLLAMFIHPAGLLVANFIRQLYPLSPDMLASLEQIDSAITGAPNFFVLLLVFAALPAICEELAFRGFIQTGLECSGRKWLAILASAVFFGAAHGILQQSLSACVLGVVIGYVAYQTKSLFPAIAFHLTYNSMTMIVGVQGAWLLARVPALRFVLRPVVSEYGGTSIEYGEIYTLVATLIGVGILYCFRQYTREESLLTEVRQRYLPKTLLPAVDGSE
ncbi:MAG TPA: ABC transporter permease subunit/CPBP intramembrane protease [Pirellulaceae bacterium]|jgi:sodium transport system permease protein|nr:ABC transporter permease subunit/CPBP intramembrane protease [Pirellulaceae bacterium]